MPLLGATASSRALRAVGFHELQQPIHDLVIGLVLAVLALDALDVGVGGHNPFLHFLTAASQSA
jgi:hypothetical protein